MKVFKLMICYTNSPPPNNLLRRRRAGGIMIAFLLLLLCSLSSPLFLEKNKRSRGRGNHSTRGHNKGEKASSPLFQKKNESRGAAAEGGDCSWSMIIATVIDLVSSKSHHRRPAALPISSLHRAPQGVWRRSQSRECRR